MTCSNLALAEGSMLNSFSCAMLLPQLNWANADRGRSEENKRERKKNFISLINYLKVSIIL
jgi:hypothetical protein